jgi:hypothetical protein
MIRIIGMAVSFSTAIIVALIVIKRLYTLKARHGWQTRDGECVRLPLMNRLDLVGNINCVYENRLDSKHIIDQFILSVEDSQPYLLCHFVEGHTTIGVLEINMFDNKERLIQTYCVNNIDAFKQLNVMALPGKTTYVNIHYDQDKNHDDYDHTRAKRTTEYKKVARLESIAVFAFLLPVTDLLFTGTHDPDIYVIYQLWYFYACLAILVMISLLNYTVISYRMEKEAEQ